MGLLSALTRKSKSRSSGRRGFASAAKQKLPIFRWFGPSATVAGVLAILGFVFTGKVEFSRLDGLTGGIGSETSGLGDIPIQPVSLRALGQKSPQTIRIATFNIQVFGDKKSQDANVMQTLAQTASLFDVIAIQEVRGGDATAVDRLVNLINRSGGSYSSIISEPIGRTSQKESYAFIWDQSRIMFLPNSAYVVQDTADRMHREPMVASFEVRTVAADGRLPFSFNMINAHTDPDEVSATSGINELDVLDDVFVRVRDFEYQTSGQEDTILVGDLNVDVRGLSELGSIPNVYSIAGDLKTNTLRTKTYDHILIDRTVTTEFTGRYGVLDFQNDFGLTQEQAIKVSDHQPVWAEFSAFESVRQPAIASDIRADGRAPR